MKKIILETSRIKKNKRKLEKSLKVNLTFYGKSASIVSLKNNEIDEYLALEVIDAINLGFSVDVALLLLNDDYMFEKLNLKESRKHNLAQVRARVIGTKGKAKKTLEKLSGCSIIVKNNTVGIIGQAEDMEIALRALNSLIHGSKHSSVFSYLERQKKQFHGDDLGLR